MSSPNRPARLNRYLLALIGLLLLAAGGFALAVHFGVIHILDPADPLVPGTEAPPTWVYYVVAAGAVLLGLLALRWLVAQAVRRPKTRTWELHQRPEQGTTRLDADVATEPLIEEIEAVAGVAWATASLSGERRDAVLYLVVGTQRGADLGELRQRIEQDAVPRLRQALDLESLPSEVEFRLTNRTPARAG
ncbi:alkaline shock response membrane anchor protein AmaP [Amycolatopsis palatopharyngis]|uniref:alkaline shock response membrane anchor protein AmaP n=1 Tax=Amycolatopsis palatopharyngis TaxID=187982 RepID=UPI000E21CBCB|nr:alkaline shock response membrane anchor protein AmaP [Amycolatopsis palatopharyngis]